ncbi:hypothetical protein [Sphingomonas sp. CARO-RG-8B-R24-01]|uniref:hypothetical protein n=1 Tax=Sphingomonas sp. CARO-RG-8B-R24-01 TaxID=2914831 RepID=UPI001F596686|nr:hypothetical protein [Sphingomonas sp. CARO-RG-8B-R24-01]
MTCIHIGNSSLARSGAIISTFSDAHDYRITVGDRVWLFDWSDQFGSSLTNGNGEIRENPYPPEGSPFWRCIMLWKRQGKRSEAFGAGSYLRTAIFDEPPAGTYTVDDRGLILNFNEPEGFDEDYSERRYVDRDGHPVKLRGRRDRRAA